MRLRSSGRVRCLKCREFPAYRPASIDDDNKFVNGERCNNCDAFRVVKARKSKHTAAREAQNARFEAYMTAVDANLSDEERIQALMADKIEAVDS